MVINIIRTYILMIEKEGIAMTINISKLESELVVSFDYSQERITKIKSINGHKWNPIDKIWTIPFTEGNLLTLKELFRNEQKNIDKYNYNRKFIINIWM